MKQRETNKAIDRRDKSKSTVSFAAYTVAIMRNSTCWFAYNKPKSTTNNS